MTVEAVIFDWGGTLVPWWSSEDKEWGRIAARIAAPAAVASTAAALIAAEEEIWRRSREEERSGTLAEIFALAGLELTAEILAMYNPGTHANHWLDQQLADFNEAEIGDMFMSHAMVDKAQNFPFMDGPAVFKKAVVKFPEVIQEALMANNLTTSDIDMLIPHQANLRIAQFVQQKLQLSDDKVYNNIQKYGNTTAASVPIALCEAWESGKISEGDLVCLAAFGSGFTWASALLRW